MQTSWSRLCRAVAVALLLAAVACNERHPRPTAPQEPPAPPPTVMPHRVLFIGNSLTETNELPTMVEALARAVGVDSFSTESILVSGWSLEDHLAGGSAAAVIANEHWDVIVLQQGPSTQPESRTQLRRDVKTFAEMAERVHARIGIYGVWPPESALMYLDDGIESYRLAAEDVNGLLFPAGKAWREAWRLDPATELYGDDRFHPSIKGTYLAALVMSARLFQRPPSDFPGQFRYGRPHGWTYVTLTETETTLFRNAAAAALE